MITDIHRCEHCHAKMTKPKPVTQGPHMGKSRIFCMNCGHMVYLVVVAQQSSSPAPQSNPQAAGAPAGEPSLVFRNGSWEIVV